MQLTGCNRLAQERCISAPATWFWRVHPIHIYFLSFIFYLIYSFFSFIPQATCSSLCLIPRLCQAFLPRESLSAGFQRAKSHGTGGRLLAKTSAQFSCFPIVCTLCITEGEGAVGLQGRALALALAPLSARRCSPPPSPPPLSTEASPFFFLPACRGSSCCCRYSCSTVDCWAEEWGIQEATSLSFDAATFAPGAGILPVGRCSSTQFVHNCNPSAFRHYVVNWSTSSQGGNQRDKPNRARHRRIGPPCQPPRLDRPRTAGGAN